ncbi:MAG: carboxypeptidase regulatory-like domain-containing protein [Acidobacteriales bacterium]|nr:carboxypeptidase regulatory-like domain-containing protein [Terriglobales bacterium]
MKRFHILTLLFSALAAVGQTSNPATPGSKTPGQAADVPKAAVSGVILSGATGQPLKKAWVVLRQANDGGPGGGGGGGRFSRAQTYATVTKEDGLYLIKDIPAGSYRLTVNRNGYVRQAYGQRGTRNPGTVVQLTAGQTMNGMNFRLTPGGVVSGRIVDEDGEPLARVALQLLRYTYVDGERRLQPSDSATTDDRGEFRIFGLQPHTYYLSANLRAGGMGLAMMENAGGPGGGLQGPASPDESYATTYYPGTNDVEGAAPIEVKGGDETRADFTLVPTRTFRVSGTVTNGATGEAAKQGMAIMMPRNSSTGFFGANMGPISGNDGKFEIRGLTPGSYVLTAFARGDDIVSGRQEVEVTEGNVEGLNVVLTPARELNGSVRVEGMSSNVKLSQLTVVFQPLGGLTMFGPPGFASVKADGTFTVKNLTQESYTTTIQNLPVGSYVKAVHAGGEDVLDSGLNVSKARGGVEIVLSMNAGTIQGSVTKSDGTAFAGAVVALSPEKPVKGRSGGIRTTSSDQNGNFTIRGLAPGNYQVYAWEEVDQEDVIDPGYLKKYADRAFNVKVSEGATRSADVKLIEADAPVQQQAGN